MSININTQLPAADVNYASRSEQPRQQTETAPQSQSDSVTLNASEPQDDSALLARRIVGQYGKTDSVKVLAGTEGGDKIHISSAPEGGLNVSINGQVTRLSKEEAAKTLIDAKGGDDIITADKDVKQRLFLTGGQGNDIISGGSGDDVIIDSYGRNFIAGNDGNDTVIASGLDLHKTDGKGGQAGNIILGGAGSDYLEGGRGSDLIIGGQGNNVIYGLDENDLISAGTGRNYIDGGRGNDIIYNEGDRGMLFGGQGDDTVVSRGQASIIADAFGTNRLEAEQGAKNLIASADSSVKTDAQTPVKLAQPIETPDSFKTAGSEAFQSRVQSDLDTLRQVEIGQKMLSSVAATPYDVTIKETANNGNSCNSGKDGHLRDNTTKEPGPGTSSTVSYNRAGLKISGRPDAWTERPPVVGLFHELAHSYNAATGTMDYGAYKYDGTVADDRMGLVGAEWQAVGLEHPHVKQNPDGLNENGMRKLLGIEERTYY
ncbi:hypothetical protein IJT93_03035 [bacterium]|nr:hypothetical protein [bacterium]